MPTEILPPSRHHLAIAYGSAIETGELLEIALDAKLISPEVRSGLLERNQRSQRLLLGLLNESQEDPESFDPFCMSPAYRVTAHAVP